MSALFTKSITTWDEWAKVFCDRDAFLPLVQAIYAREGLPVPARLGGLTPGTNAVFRAGDTVVKVFVPPGPWFDSARDYETELAMLRYAQAQGIATSTLLAAGEIADKYLFRYLILAHVDGQEAGEALGAMSATEKRGFAQALRGLTHKLNQPAAGVLQPIDLKARAVHNPRLNMLPDGLRADMIRRTEALGWDRDVIVHGDMTGENLLVTPQGGLVLIDFADSVLGPYWYEYAPIVFELFDCDHDLVRAFAGEGDLRAFVREVVDAVALHDFGANILCDFQRRWGITIPTLDALETRLLEMWI